MQVLTKSYPGLIICCSKCGALLSYQVADIYSNMIYCPLCKGSTEVPLDKNYNGLIKEKKNV